MKLEAAVNILLSVAEPTLDGVQCLIPNGDRS